MNLEEQIQDVYDELERVSGSYSLQNKEIVFNCVQKAIQTKDKELEFETRFEYLSQLVFLNFNDEAIAYFPWFLNFKKNNELSYSSYHQLVWSFKWIINKVASYGKIPLSQIHALFKQFENEVREFGGSTKVIEYFGVIYNLDLGDLVIADEHYKKYKKLRKTSNLDDCYACQINNMVDLQIAKKDYKKAVVEAQDIASKTYSCASVPKTTYPKLTFCYMMLDNNLKAEELYQLAVKNLNFSEPQITNVYYLFFYLAKNDQFLKAKKILDKQMQFAIESNADIEKFKFFAGCYLIFKKAEQSNVKMIKLQKNDGIDCNYDEKGYDTVEMKNWFKTKSEYHFQILDERNENQYYQNYFKYLDENI